MVEGKIIGALKKLKEGKKRNFTQSIDLVIALSNLDLKGGQKIEEFFILPGQFPEKKICALVGIEMKVHAEKFCDKVITEPDFPKWNKIQIKKLVKEFDFFVAQANIMTSVAKTFGKVLGTAGKMPNPKAGQVVPSNARLDLILPKMRKTVKLRTTKAPVINCKLGDEKTPEEEIAKNIEFIIEQLVPKLPLGKQNIKKVMVKTTMGSPVVVEL